MKTLNTNTPQTSLKQRVTFAKYLEKNLRKGDSLEKFNFRTWTGFKVLFLF